MKFSHLINPFLAAPGSEHERAQRITFAALQSASQQASQHGVSVEVLGVVFPKDEGSVADPARAIPNLHRHVGDVASLRDPAPLPLLRDILDAGSAAAEGEYLIFTNMDICPQPYFYRALAELVADDPEAAFVIPRRTISAAYTDPTQLSSMLLEQGTPHEGFDCFVFPRTWVSQLDLGNLCIGIPGFDLALILNLEAITGFKTKVLWHQFLTFHIGNDQAWSRQSELNAHNQKEAVAIEARLAARCGPIPPRSKYEYIRVWLQQAPAPAASLPRRIGARLAQSATELRARWQVRKFRRELGLPGW